MGTFILILIIVAIILIIAIPILLICAVAAVYALLEMAFPYIIGFILCVIGLIIAISIIKMIKKYYFSPGAIEIRKQRRYQRKLKRRARKNIRKFMRINKTKKGKNKKKR